MICGAKCLSDFLLFQSLEVLEVPLAVVAVEVELRKGRGAVGDGDEAERLVAAGDGLRHDAVGAVGELVDPPELGVGAVERGALEFAVSGGGKGPVGTLDDDLEVRTAEIAAGLRDSDEGPLLVRAVHIVSDADGGLLRPVADDLLEFLVLDDHVGLVAAAAEASHTTLCADEVDGQFKGVAPADGFDLVGAFGNEFADLRPVVLPDDGTDGEGAPSAQVKVGLPVEGCLLDAFLEDDAAEVAGTETPLFGSGDHLAATFDHGASDIVDERAVGVLGAACNDIIGGVHAIAAGAVGAEEVVPAVIVGHHSGLAVDGDVDGLAALETMSGLGIELDLADESEVGAVDAEEPAGAGVEEEADVDGVAVFVNERRCHFHGFGVLEIRGIRVESLVPHGQDAACVTAAETAAGGAVADEIPVTDLYCVRCCAAAGADCAAVPDPAVLGDEAAAAGAEGVVLAVALHDGGRVMDIGCSDLCGKGLGSEKGCEGNCPDEYYS